MRTKHAGFFETFGRNFNCIKWHKTRYKVQGESTSMCGLHTIYFITCMIDLRNRAKYIECVDVGAYVPTHYDTNISSKND